MNEAPAILILLSPSVPLLIALALMAMPDRRMPRLMAPWAALPALFLALMPTPPIAFHLPWVLLGADFGLDAIGRVFMLFTSLLWLASGIFAHGHLSGTESRTRFFVYFLLAMSGNLGLIVAQDMLSFYLFFALMSFSSYGLVVHERTVEALRAGRVYIILAVVGEVLLFAAMVLAERSAGSLAFEAVRSAVAGSGMQYMILLFTLLAFGIKVGVVGLHMWLPLAHPVAPIPASAVLSGAMIKAGLLGWLRLLPLGEVALPQWGGLMMAAGLAATFYGVLVGVMQGNPKTVLAYSSISQMGIITIGVGFGLAVPQAWPMMLSVVLVYALHHSLAKGALFLGVGVASAGSLSTWQRRLTGLGLLLPALALMGAPLTSGIIAKSLLKAQLMIAPEPWGHWLNIFLPWSSVATSLIMVRFLYLAWPKKGEARSAASGSGVTAASWIALLAISSFTAWFISLAIIPDLWSASALIASLWPIALGSGLAFFAARLSARSVFRRLSIVPPGDILGPIEKSLVMIVRWGDQLGLDLLPRWREASITGCRRLLDCVACVNALKSVETWLSRWTITATLFVLLAMAAVFFAAN